VIPGEARNLQAFPSFNKIRPSPPANTLQIIWDKVGFETITLSYSIETEVQSYQDKLARGTFLLTLGIPILVTIAIDLLWWAPRRSAEEFSSLGE
jgi:hypothetical protein